MLIFDVGELQAEVHAIEALVAPFTEPEAPSILRAFATQLNQLKNTTREIEWSIPAIRPVRIKQSRTYEKGEEGREVWATLSCLWQVRARPIVRKKPLQAELCGKASTRVMVYGADSTLLADWTMDVADKTSPGCYFHAQLARPADPNRAPNDEFKLPVPRLPFFLATPALCLEFVVSELFQEDWPKAFTTGDAPKRYRSIQQRRFQKWLEWQVNKLGVPLQRAEPSKGSELRSPWSVLKEAQPDPGLFTA